MRALEGLATATRLDLGDCNTRSVLPDYAPIDTLFVPFRDDPLATVLDPLARAASEYVKVVLVGGDPDRARTFVQTQPRSDRFEVQEGRFDSFCLRDHAPIACLEGGRLCHVRPRRPGTDAAPEAGLFGRILPGCSETTALMVSGGNLICGADGLAVSSNRLLMENALSDAAPLEPVARQLGIRDWLMLPPFPDDPGGQAESMLRFLSPDLVALCARVDRADAALVTAEMRCALAITRPELTLIELPASASDQGFDSPFGWLQFGRTLLMPHFGAGDRLFAARQARLESRGFSVLPIPALPGGHRGGGALHGLTAALRTG